MPKEIKYNINIPVQTISYADKIADDFEWGKKTMLGYIQRSYFSATQHKLAIKKLYDYYNGHVNVEDYKNMSLVCKWMDFPDCEMVHLLALQGSLKGKPYVLITKIDLITLIGYNTIQTF